MKPGRKQPIKLESLTAKLKVELETAQQQIKVIPSHGGGEPGGERMRASRGALR
jgi:hypothetical protein